MNNLIFFVVVSSTIFIVSCNNKTSKAIAKAELNAPKILDSLISLSSDDCYEFCLKAHGVQEIDQQVISSCNIIPIPALFIEKANKGHSFRIKSDTSFLLCFILNRDSVLGLIRAGKRNNRYYVRSQIPLYLENGKLNGSIAKIEMDLIKSGNKIYTIRYSSEYYVYAIKYGGKLKIISFSYGHIRNYVSIKDWVKSRKLFTN